MADSISAIAREPKIERDETSIMDISIGSDGERCSSPQSPPITPTESEKSLQMGLKFSIANILSPEFGNKTGSPSPERDDKSLSPTPTPPIKAPVAQVATSTAASAAAMAAAAALTLASQPVLFPAWVYCTRYSDRPSSGPRCRRVKRKAADPVQTAEEKRPRTAFTSDQLNRLKAEFQANRYLTEKRRQELAHELGLNESQIKIWFQNKRAKIKKSAGLRHPLALHLMAQGLYNHATVPVQDDDDDSGPSKSTN